jgi:hypothetical protein
MKARRTQHLLSRRHHNTCRLNKQLLDLAVPTGGYLTRKATRRQAWVVIRPLQVDLPWSNDRPVGWKWLRSPNGSDQAKSGANQSAPQKICDKSLIFNRVKRRRKPNSGRVWAEGGENSMPIGVVTDIYDTNSARYQGRSSPPFIGRSIRSGLGC